MQSSIRIGFACAALLTAQIVWLQQKGDDVPPIEITSKEGTQAGANCVDESHEGSPSRGGKVKFGEFFGTEFAVLRILEHDENHYLWLKKQRQVMRAVQKLEMRGVEFRWNWLCGRYRCFAIIEHSGREVISGEYLGGWSGKPKHFSVLKNIPGLYGIEIESVSNLDACLAALEGNNSISCLILHEPDIRNCSDGFASTRGIASLEKVPNLTTLHLYQKKPTEEMLVALKQLAAKTRLQQLRLCHPSGDIADRIVDILGPIRTYNENRMRIDFEIGRGDDFYLELRDADFWVAMTPPPAYCLRGWGPGTEICVRIDNSRLPLKSETESWDLYASLQYIERLRSLSLSDLGEQIRFIEEFEGDGLTTPIKIKEQTTGLTIKSAVLQVLPQLTMLTSLTLEGKEISDDIISAASELPRLEAVGVSGGKIGDEQIKILGQLGKTPNLRVLFLDADVQISHGQFDALQDGLSSTMREFRKESVLLVKEHR